MKKSKLLKTGGCIVLMLFILFARNRHIHLPGHGNVENRNLEKSVITHVSSILTDGRKVEFAGKYLCKDYIENGEVRFSANVIYNTISENGLKEMHTAHVVCNEDKDKIIEWKDL